MRGKYLQVAQLLLVVAPAFILFGYNQSGVGGLLSINSWTETFPRIDTVHTKGAQKSNNSTIQGLVVATFTLGALCGALGCSWFGDKFGRRKTIFGGAALTLVGEILQCTSFALPQFIIGRTILGAGIGALSATVPVWQSESSSASNRGKHVVLDGCFISFGYTLQAWIDLAFYQFKTGSISWRLPLALPCLVSVGLMCSIWMFPESPRWLVKEGRSDEAREALSILKDASPQDIAVVQEVAGIEHSLEDTSGGATRLKDMFTMGPNKLFYRFSLCIFLQFLQQMCGSNLISVYSTIIFQQGLSLDSQTSRILTGGTLTWKFLSCFVAFFTIDRFGRRALFMFSGFGMAGCMAALAVATSFPTSNKSAQIASVVFVFMFNFFIPIGFLGANFLYCTEVAPTRLRVTMASISTANHWLWNFVVVMVTPVAIESIGYQYYIVFAVISGIIPISVYLFFPETMGRSLEDMESLFTEHSSIFTVVRASLKGPGSADATRRGSKGSEADEEKNEIEKVDSR